MFSKKILQQHWQSQSAPQKFLAYEKAYSNTGYIGFPALKIVASMARKGTVFTPDKARQIIDSIQTETAQIAQLVAQIQGEIDAFFGHSAYSQLQTPLRDLGKRIVSLTQGIEKEIMSISGLTPSERDKFEKHLSAMNHARIYLVERFNIDIEDAKTGNLSNLQRIEKYLTSIDSSAHEFAIAAQKTIEQRVPFDYLR